MLSHAPSARSIVRRAGAAVAFSVVALALVTNPASADDPGAVQCDGTLINQTISGDVVVPENRDCILDGTTVTGDVYVDINATLSEIDGAVVQGQIYKPQECTGTLQSPATFTSIHVPDGATCTLQGVTVGGKGSGNVSLGTGASLFAYGASMEGNFQAVHGAIDVGLYDTNVGENVHVVRAKHRVTIGSADCAIDPTVGHNVIILRSSALIALCSLTVGNNIIVQHNTKTIGIFGNSIANNLDVGSNSGVDIRMRDNVIGTDGGGNLNFHDNLTQNLNLFSANSARGSFNCTGNTGTFTGTGNTASGTLNDQCSVLG